MDRGVSMEMLEYIRKVGAGGGNRYLQSKALMQNTAANAPLVFEELKGKKYQLDGKEISYNEAYEAGDIQLARRLQGLINNEWIEKSGISQFNPQMVGTEKYPGVLSHIHI